MFVKLKQGGFWIVTHSFSFRQLLRQGDGLIRSEFVKSPESNRLSPLIYINRIVEPNYLTVGLDESYLQ